jgi:hypothetical protein
VPRVSTSARRDLDGRLAEDSDGSRFERFVFMPYMLFVVVVSLGAGVALIAWIFGLR